MAAILGVTSGRRSRSEPPHGICACTHSAQRTPTKNSLGASAEERDNNDGTSPSITKFNAFSSMRTWNDMRTKLVNVFVILNPAVCAKIEPNELLQSIYVTRDRVILKFEARVQIYVVVLNIGCKIQNSGGNVVFFFFSF